MTKSNKNIYFYPQKIGFGCYLLGTAVFHFLLKTIWGKALTAILFLAAIAVFLVVEMGPGKFPANQSLTLRVPAGAHFRQIADSLRNGGLLKNRTLFLAIGRITGKDKNVRAGLFEIPGGLNAWQLLNYLETAPAKRFKVTLTEGILSYKMAAILQKRIGVDSTQFVDLVYDSSLARSFAPEAPNLEGYLQPETYFFEWKTGAKRVIQRLVSRTLHIFEPDSVQFRMKQLGWNRREVLTLASIIEGEAVVDSERAIISSLYHNRLRLGWPLQADPTIQFAIPGPPRRLLNKDLEFDSPYNTYKYKGLPPGPINNPGRRSILAALFPRRTSYLYMVAMGDGRHKFSRTLREHNRWHARFNEIRRKNRRTRKRLRRGSG